MQNRRICVCTYYVSIVCTYARVKCPTSDRGDVGRGCREVGVKLGLEGAAAALAAADALISLKKKNEQENKSLAYTYIYTYS